MSVCRFIDLSFFALTAGPKERRRVYRTTMARKVAFLDRDGTINLDAEYVHRIDQWAFIDRVPEALHMLQRAGFALAIVTDQSGIGVGRYTESDVHTLHAHMRELLRSADVTIDAIAFCPHRPDSGCACRKPQPAMAKIIEQQLGPIQYDRSVMIGDKPTDVGFGKAIGTKTILLRSAYWKEEELPTIQPDVVADSLFDAAQRICLSPTSSPSLRA